MTGQDVAVLVTLQLAILAAAALTAWTCWHAGYARGYRDADVFGRLKRAMRESAERLQRELASWTPRLRIPETDHRTDAMRHALMLRAGMTVQDPRSVTKVTHTGV